MFVHIHIPIIDCRSLCSSFQRLKRPVFPIPEENDFIRNFGKVSLNYIPALPCYAGEDWFFRGENTVRFKELPRFRIRIGKQYYNCQSKFRRLFCNGKMANRYEVGLEFTGMVLHELFEIFPGFVKSIHKTKVVNYLRIILISRTSKKTQTPARSSCRDFRPWKRIEYPYQPAHQKIT